MHHLLSLGPGPGDLPYLVPFPHQRWQRSAPKTGQTGARAAPPVPSPPGLPSVKEGAPPAQGYAPQLLPCPAAASLGSVIPNCTSFHREWLPLLISCTPNISQEGLPKQLVETVCQFLEKLSLELTNDPAIPLLGVYPRSLETYLHTVTST